MQTERMNISINKQVREKLKNINKDEIIEKLIFAATYKKEYNKNYIESWGNLANVCAYLPLDFVYTLRVDARDKEIITNNLNAREIRQILNIMAMV